MRFLTPFIANAFFERAQADTLATMAEDLKYALSRERCHAERLYGPWALCYLAQKGFSGDITVHTVLHPRTRAARASTVRTMTLQPCAVRSYLDANHLSRLVAADLTVGHGLGLYVPLAPDKPYVHAWCVASVGGRLVVVGLRVPVDESRDSITGETEAEAQFDAIRTALDAGGVSTSDAAWVVSVLPALKCPALARLMGGEQPGVWPHTQAKLVVSLDDLGRLRQDGSEPIQLTTASG